MAFNYFLGILVLAACVEFGTSIRCYECNSANNSMCLNPTIYDVETVQKYLTSTSCDRSAFLAPSHASKQMFCRKIVQTNTVYDVETAQKYVTSISCDRSAFVAPNHAAKQMFCRKIVQTILHKGHDPEVRVTRGCGWVKHHKDCYKADNEDHLETVCQCFTDDCNDAATIRLGVTTALISLGLILIKF